MDRQLRSGGVKKTAKAEKPKKKAKALGQREATGQVEFEDLKVENKAEDVKASKNPWPNGYYGAMQARREIPPWLCKKAKAAPHIKVEGSKVKNKVEDVKPMASKNPSWPNGYYGAMQARREIPPWLCKKAKTTAKPATRR